MSSQPVEANGKKTNCRYEGERKGRPGTVGEEGNQNQAGIVEVREGVRAGGYKGTGEDRDDRIVGGRNLERTAKAGGGGVAEAGVWFWTMVGRKYLQDAVEKPHFPVRNK